MSYFNEKADSSNLIVLKNLKNLLVQDVRYSGNIPVLWYLLNKPAEACSEYDPEVILPVQTSM